MNDVTTPERYPSREDASIYVMRRGIVGRAHVAISAHQTGDDLRIRFRPLYGWTVQEPVTDFGLELFGVRFEPIPLPRTFHPGEYVKSSTLDLRMADSFVEPAEVTV